MGVAPSVVPSGGPGDCYGLPRFHYHYLGELSAPPIQRLRARQPEGSTTKGLVCILETLRLSMTWSGEVGIEPPSPRWCRSTSPSMLSPLVSVAVRMRPEAMSIVLFRVVCQ